MTPGQVDPPAATFTPLPSGTVTFLFSDIDRVTSALAAAPEVVRTALDRHDAILRQTIAEHHGALFKTVGNAFYAAFARPAEAMSAAVTAQRTLQAESWPPGAHPAVRMAIHLGEAELRDGDYFGTTMNRVARLLAAGHGDQVLATQSVIGVVADLLAGEATLTDLGEHQLRDLSRQVRVYQVQAPGLRRDFPPLVTLNRRLHNLPIQLTSLVGREQELEVLAKRLDETRLLTLTGIGGTGKTRLALQLAAESADRFADGVWLVELAPVVQPELLPTTVAAVLGVHEEPGRSIEQTLLEHLRARRLLLLLDNCEHLLEPCARLTNRLLVGVPGLRSLATSREALGVGGEVTWPVSSLSLPPVHEHEEDDDAAEIERSAAVQLFVERAREARPGFSLNPASATAVAQICRRLDGIPLAIELAAARVRLLTPEQIAVRLDDRFRLLTGGSRTALAHHHTLEAALDWSHDLLEGPERAVFRRLAVFRGGWTLEAAEQVAACGEVESWQVLDALAHLVDKSLVVAEDRGGHGRYHFLETVRLYARGKLLSSADEAPAREAHRAFFLTLATEADHGIQKADQDRAILSLEVEHDNVRAAIENAVASGDGEAANAFGMVMWWFWYVHGHWTEGRSRLDAILAIPGNEGATRARAGALTGAGVLAFHQGDLAAARNYHQDGLAIRRTIDDPRGVASSLANLGNVAFVQGDYQGAKRLYEESLAIMRARNDRQGEATLLSNLSTIANTLGDFAEARRLLDESLLVLQALGDTSGFADALSNMGLVAANQGDYEAAAATLRESLGRRRDLGDKNGVASSLSHLGRVAMARGDLDASRSLVHESLSLRRELGDKHGIAGDTAQLGLLAVATGQAAAGHDLLDESLALCESLDDQVGGTEVVGAVAYVAALAGDWCAAATLMAAADAGRERLGIAALGDTGAKRRAEVLDGAESEMPAADLTRCAAQGQALTAVEAMAAARSWLKSR